MVTLIIVTAIFYIPFHVGPPVLLSLLYGRDAAQRKMYTQQILVDSFLDAGRVDDCIFHVMAKPSRDCYCHHGGDDGYSLFQGVEV